MEHRAQSLLFWAKKFGYLGESQVDDSRLGSHSVEEYLKDFLDARQMALVRLVFVEQCLLQAAQRQGHFTEKQCLDLLQSRVEEMSRDPGNLSLFGGLEKAPLPDPVLRTLARMLHESGRLTREDCLLLSSSEEPKALSSQTQAKEFSFQLGPYRIQEEIGSGGMGKVYRAFHPKLQKTVAIKVMLQNRNVSPKERERFLSEAQLTAQLRHPNIITVHDIGNDGGKDYIVMDFIEGESLGSLLKKQTFSPRRAMELMRDIAYAMGDAHAKNIVHRDLKPVNIMIEKATGRPLIMDFGLAKNIELGKDLTRSGEIVGTPRYMPPEQAEGRKRDPSPTADVYALGAILYEMLAGIPAIQGSEPLHILHNVLYQEIVPPGKFNPRIAKTVEVICLKCLEKKSGRRYPNAKELAADIDRFLNGEAILARPASFGYRCWKKVVRHRAIAMSLLLVLLVSVGVFWGTTHSSRQWAHERMSAWYSRYQESVRQDMEILDHHERISKEGEENVDEIVSLYQEWKKVQDEDIKRQQMSLLDPGALLKKIEMISNDWPGEKEVRAEVRDPSIYLKVMVEKRKELFHRWKTLQKMPDLIAKYREFDRQQKRFENDPQLSSALLRLKKNVPASARSIKKESPESFILEIAKRSQAFLSSENLIPENTQEKAEISWKASCALALDRENEKAAAIKKKLGNACRAQYLVLLEKIIHQKNISLTQMALIREELEQLCLVDIGLSEAYYRIGRIYHQSDHPGLAFEYYRLSIAGKGGEEKEKKEDEYVAQDFFALCHLAEILYHRWYGAIGYIHDQGVEDSSIGTQVASLEREFQEIKEKLKHFPIGEEQKPYLLFHEFYEISMARARHLLARYRKSEKGGFLFFYLCPPGSLKTNPMDEEEYRVGIETYLRLSEKLETIQGEQFAGQVNLLKAKIKSDLVLLKERSADSLAEVLGHFQEAVAQRRLDYDSWIGLARFYLIFGDFASSEAFYRQASGTHQEANWYYVLCLLNQKEKQALALEELAHHIAFHSRSLNLRSIQIDLNLLLFLSLKEGQSDRFSKFFKFLYPVSDSKNETINAQMKSYLSNFLLIVNCIKGKDPGKAMAGAKTLWHSIGVQWPHVRQVTELQIKVMLPYLQHYADPFVGDPAYRRVPTQLDEVCEKITRMKQGAISYQAIDHSGIIQSIVRFIETDEETRKQIQTIGLSVTGQKDTFLMMLQILNKIFFDLFEKRLLEMEYPASHQIHYRRAIAHYRKSLYDRDPKGRRHSLHQSLKNVRKAALGEPSNLKYHYAMALLLGNLLAENPSWKEELYFHLELSLKLGWNDYAYLLKEEAFKALTNEKRFMALLKERPLPLSRYSLEYIGAEVETILKQGRSEHAWMLLSAYRKELGFVQEKVHLPLEKGLLDQAKESMGQEEKEMEVRMKAHSLPAEREHALLKRMALLYVARALEHKKRGLLAEARKDFDHALEIDPNCWRAYLERAMLHKETGNDRAYHRDWQKAIALQPKTASEF